MRSHLRYKQLAPLLVFALAFLLVSYAAQRYHEALSLIIAAGGVFGVIGYILLTVLFVVFVIPLDIAMLIPIGAVVFGPVPTAMMNIIGWTLGAAIAFGIARRFGRPVVETLIGLERVHEVERHIPKRNLFWTVVFLRMFVSVDILSYALGLTSSMPWSNYVLSTMIGVTPFSFYFSYAGTLPLGYRVLAILSALLLAVIVLWRYSIRREP